MLEALFHRWAGDDTNARWWVGERPDGCEGALPRLIAAQVGYPTATHDPFDGFIAIDRVAAARILAVAGTTSLAYGDYYPSPGAIADGAAALAAWGDAAFLTNGPWAPETVSWRPMTDATFDAGVIGYDATRAFIFWVEEED